MPQPKLEPLPYHIELRDYLKSNEPELWDWFSSAQAKADYTADLRLQLLKSTYRLDPQGHPDLYACVEEVKTRLQLELGVTLYQAQQSPESNASLFFVSGEGHVVFSGPVLSLLNADEIKSVLGHELAHYHLWQRNEGEFHVADRLLQAVAQDPRAAVCHEQTARRYQLYTEIFADRGALHVIGDVHPVISGLVKIQTGLTQVSAPAYLKQAEEILAKGTVAAEGLSHPEAFIRAHALTLWQEQGDDASVKISAMIEGAPDLDQLDLIGQTRLTHATQRLLEHFLQPKWFQTPATLAHAKLFFDDFKPLSAKDPSSLKDLEFADAKLREYVCYLLLDFVAVDPELEEITLAAALELSRELELISQFERLASKELRIKARELRRIKEQAPGILAKAEVRGA